MIPLVTRSCYSFMRGTSQPQTLCKTARQLGYRQLALTDTDNLYGMWTFLTACRKESIIPIIGAEVTEPNSRKRVTCLVENEIGFRNLCQLLSRRHCDDDFQLTKALEELAVGLVVPVTDEQLLVHLHGLGILVAAALCRRPTEEGRRLRRVARQFEVPAVAVPDSYFSTPGEYDLHRVLRAIDGNTSLSRLAKDQVDHPEAWLASPAEYKSRFSIWPEVIENSHILAKRLSFTGPQWGIVLPPYGGPGDKSPVDLLRQAAYEGAQCRYGIPLTTAVVDRLEHELVTIERMGFSSYFLVVRDIVRPVGIGSGPLICGRGSGAASLVAYCLGITNVCPMKHNLYFERFLNPGRTDPPDIDIDFAWDERDDILAGVLDKFGDHAAMVSSHILFQPRMAIRETAKVFGLADGEIGRITKRLSHFRHGLGKGDDWLSHLHSMPEMGQLDLPDPWLEILDFSRRMIGFPRYLSVHPGGVIITPRPVAEYVPVQYAPKGVPIIHWDKDSAEEAGLVKIDLLGNRSLGVIRDALANGRKNGVYIDTDHWEPEDDQATQATISRGGTMGCFYIESPAMRLLQQKARDASFEQVVLQSSIIRPAANNWIREYVRRLHGGSWPPLHPVVEEVLSETYGIMVYQEDVSRVAVALAGFSHVEADELRKVMAKKHRHRIMGDYRQRFAKGARSRGASEEVIERLWQMMQSFSGYSFCKPHSASYARVSFQAGYLKTHLPAEFMAAVLSNQGGFYSTFAYVSEARRLGLVLLHPNVNKSELRWQGRRKELQVGLMAVRGLSRKTMQQIVEKRRQAMFASVADFLERVNPPEDELRQLVMAGGLDSIAAHQDRSLILWEAARRQKDRNGKIKGSLFRAGSIVLPTLPKTPKRQKLRREFQALEFLCTCHPLSQLQDRLENSGRIMACNLFQNVGRMVRLAGWLITGKTVGTKHGETMQFLTFEDESGVAETVFFPTAYRRFSSLLESGRPYILHGRVEEEFGVVTLNVEYAGRL